MTRDAGGNIHCLAELAGIFHLDVRNIGALAGGVSKVHSNGHIPISNSAGAPALARSARRTTGRALTQAAADPNP